jgi:ribosomal protein S18 acetylase RimI-like enzyme
MEMLQVMAFPNGGSLVLGNGYRATIRPITAASRPLIETAMTRLSPESSRRRFFTPRFRLSERELIHLTSPDGVRHFAVGVCGRNADGTLEGIAAARFVRTDDNPAVAEIALTVIDAFQGMGIGKTLLAHLIAAATARGIDRLRALMTPDNTPVLRMLRRYAPSSRFAYDGEILTADIPLSGLPLARAA